MNPTRQNQYDFEGFSVIPAEYKLLVGGKNAKVSTRAFDLLWVLIQAEGDVVTKDQLLERVWPGMMVEENNLQVHVSTLRRLCGVPVIATIPGRGYRLIAAPKSRQTSAGSDALESSTAPPSPNEQEFEASAPSGNLPTTIAPLLGRQEEIVEICEALKTQRLVTVTGAGGVGKTHLSLVVAQTLQPTITDGVWFIELATIVAPEMVATTVAQALNIGVSNARAPLDSVITTLTNQTALLVLDNCEHQLEAVSEICNALLQHCPQVRLLLTSQELLKNSNEYVYKLVGLTVPTTHNLDAAQQASAIQLLVTRVQQRQRQFELTADNLNDAITICRHLDGLPLAIELVAARVHLLGLTGVRERLGELFRLLTGGSRVKLRRHQTIRAAIDWSYALLNDDERDLFCTLGVFAGGVSLQGVQEVSRLAGLDEWGVLDTLANLVDRSLVHVSANEPMRYSLLELTRAYAIEQLAASGKTDQVLARHAQTVRKICEGAAQERDFYMSWSEAANVRAAYAWAMSRQERELAIALATHSSVVFAVAGLAGEAVSRLEAVESLVQAETLPKRLQARYWQWLGRCGIDDRIDPARCIRAFDQSEQLWRELGSTRNIHACLRMRAEAYLEMGDLENAQKDLDATLESETEKTPSADKMRRLRVQGLVAHASGRSVKALNFFHESLILAQEMNSARYRYVLVYNIGRTLLDSGEAQEALVHFEHALGASRSDALMGLVLVYAHIGRAEALAELDRLAEAKEATLAAVDPALDSNLVLAHAESFAFVLARLDAASAATQVLQASDAMRAQRSAALSKVKRQLKARVEQHLQKAKLASQAATLRVDSAVATQAQIAMLIKEGLRGG